MLDKRSSSRVLRNLVSIGNEKIAVLSLLGIQLKSGQCEGGKYYKYSGESPHVKLLFVGIDRCSKWNVTTKRTTTNAVDSFTLYSLVTDFEGANRYRLSKMDFVSSPTIALDSIRLCSDSFVNYQKLTLAITTSTVVVLYVAFSFPGEVTVHLDLRGLINPEGLAIPESDYRYIEETTIEHGWPWPFLIRETKLSFDDGLPTDFKSYPPFLVSKLWNPWLGYNSYTFKLWEGLADLLILFVLFVVTFQLTKILQTIWSTGSFQMNHLLFMLFTSAIVAWPAAQHYNRYADAKNFEAQCRQIGCSLNGVSIDPTYSRLFGEQNVPNDLKFSRNIFAIRVPAEEFLTVVRNTRSPYIRYMCTSKRLVIDDELLRLITQNFSLKVISIGDPTFEVDDPSPLNSIEKVHLSGLTVEDRIWLEEELTTSVIFYGTEIPEAKKR